MTDSKAFHQSLNNGWFAHCLLCSLMLNRLYSVAWVKLFGLKIRALTDPLWHNKSSLLQAIKAIHPGFQASELEKKLQALNHDLPVKLLGELLIEYSHSLSKDDLLAQYQIIKPIATGGMGEVYLAKRVDGQFEKLVALKILSKGLITDETLLWFQIKHRNTQQLKAWFID